MSRKHEIESLEAEIATVNELLSEAKGISDLVGQDQYQNRLEELILELGEIRTASREHAHVALLFAGGPVEGSRGIQAEFAGRIIEGFQNLIGRLFAQEELGNLGKRGKVPYSKHTHLMVTGVAHGSFGFVFDEMSDQEDMYDTQLKTIVSRATDLIIGTGARDESAFDARIEELDSRALVALKDLFVEMDSKGAEIRIRDDEGDQYLDKDTVHRARLRIEATEIDESSEDLEGILRGFLPEHRKFEIVDAANNVIYGAVTKEAVSQFRAMVSQGEVAIEVPCKVRMQIRTVTPLNRPARNIYRLLQFVSIGGEDTPLLESPDN